MVRVPTSAAALCCALLAACSAPPDVTPSLTPSPTLPTASGLIEIRSPYEGQVLYTSHIGALIQLSAQVDPASLQLWLDGELLPAVPLATSNGWEVHLETDLEAGAHSLRVAAQANSGRQEMERAFVSRLGQSSARVITRSEERVTGESSIGRVGDLLLENGQARFVIQGGERPFLGVGAFGGTLVDGDIPRLPWEEGHDLIGSLALGINLENTLFPTELRIVADGTAGGPAIVEAAGPDDLLATFNVSSIATLFTSTYLTSVPPSADDVDLPVTLINRYILEPNASYLIWETDVTHTGSATLSFYFGDYVSMTGNVELFGPGSGFGAVDVRTTCDWFGYLDHSAPGEGAVGYIPELWEDSSLLTMQGVQYPWWGQNGLQALLTDAAPPFSLGAGETRTFRRWIPVGRDLGAISDVWLRISRPEKKVGFVKGRVTRAGESVAGARVAVLAEGSSGEAPVTHFVTDSSGTFSGTLEVGQYRLLASQEGAALTDGAPVEQVLQLSEGLLTPVLFELPAISTLQVRVTAGTGAPLPARITLVGLDPSPDPAGTDPSVGRGVHAVLTDPDRDPLPFGLVQVLYADAQGETGAIPVDPGEYAAVISRGPAYSTQTIRLTIEPGEAESLEAALIRVLDVPDFAGGDFHIHSIDSFDAPIPRHQRLATLLAEGLDVFAATDHTIRIDYNPLIEAEGASDLLAALMGEEVTTFDIGHYNLFPLVADPTQVNLGGVNWAGDAPPGEGFPSKGAYNLSPSELMTRLGAEEGAPVIQLNHLNNVLHGLFSLQGVDTAQVPPRSVMPRELFRQDPALTNLFTDGYTVMEIWRGYTDAPELVFGENLGDVFNLLNQGIVRTWTSNSDTHGTIESPVGGPRNFIGLGEARGQALADAPEQVAQAMREGRVVLSNAPFVRVTLQTAAGWAGLEPGLPTQLEAPEGRASLAIEIQSPDWARFDEVSVFVNTQPRALPDDDDAPGMVDYQGMDLSALDVPRYEPLPTLVLHAGEDFDIESVAVTDGGTQSARLEASLELPLPGLTQDAWVVVMVRGTDGVSPPLFPVLPANLEPVTNLSLDDLMDGNLGEGGILALAITNPLFLDVDGNGRFDPPGIYIQVPDSTARRGAWGGRASVSAGAKPTIRPGRYGM